jgi:hypothetical protein
LGLLYQRFLFASTVVPFQVSAIIKLFLEMPMFLEIIVLKCQNLRKLQRMAKKNDEHSGQVSNN